VLRYDKTESLNHSCMRSLTVQVDLASNGQAVHKLTSFVNGSLVAVTPTLVENC
jgi:hypothetical protein